MCILFLKACNENGNDNIATFEEVSSCVYEMVVVSKWICSHPAYRSFFRKQMFYLLSKKNKINCIILYYTWSRQAEKSKQSISCYAVDGSPAQPLQLDELQKEFSQTTSRESMIKVF